MLMAETNASESAPFSETDVGSNRDTGDTLALNDLLQADESDPCNVSSHLQFRYDTDAGAIRVDITNSSGTYKQSIAVPGVDVTAGGALSDSQIIQMLLAQGKLTHDI